MNKKAFILGANFGPYEDEQFINHYKRLFTKYDDVCFRDNYSYRIFEHLDNVRRAADIVFTLDTEVNQKPEKIVGFSIINIEKRKGLVEYYNQYNKKINDLIECYIEKGYKIKLFSFCENEGDLEVIKTIFKKVNHSYRNEIKIVNYEGDLDSFLNEFKSCEIIVGTRFHSIILAMLNNQSFYPIIYSKKTLDLLKDLKKDDVCCDIKDIVNLDVKSVIGNIEDNKVEDRNMILDANKQFKKLDQFLT